MVRSKAVKPEAVQASEHAEKLTQQMFGLPKIYCQDSGNVLRRLYTKVGGINAAMENIAGTLSEQMLRMLEASAKRQPGPWTTYGNRQGGTPLHILALPFIGWGNALIAQAIEGTLLLNSQCMTEGCPEGDSPGDRLARVYPVHKMILLHQLGYLGDDGSVDQAMPCLSFDDVRDDLEYLASRTALLYRSRGIAEALAVDAVEWPYRVRAAAVAAKTFHGWGQASEAEQDRALALAWAVLLCGRGETASQGFPGVESLLESVVAAPMAGLAEMFCIGAGRDVVLARVEEAFEMPQEKARTLPALIAKAQSGSGEAQVAAAAAPEAVRSKAWPSAELVGLIDPVFPLYLPPNVLPGEAASIPAVDARLFELYGVNPVLALEHLASRVALHLLQADRCPDLGLLVSGEEKILPLAMVPERIRPYGGRTQSATLAAENLFVQQSAHPLLERIKARLLANSRSLFADFVLRVARFRLVCLLGQVTPSLAMPSSICDGDLQDFFAALDACHAGQRFEALDFLEHSDAAVNWHAAFDDLADRSRALGQLHADQQVIGDAALAVREMGTALVSQLSSLLVDPELADMARLEQELRAFSGAAAKLGVPDADILPWREHWQTEEVAAQLVCLATTVRLSKEKIQQVEGIPAQVERLIREAEALWRQMPGWCAEAPAAVEPGLPREQAPVVLKQGVDPARHDRALDRVDALEVELEKSRNKVRLLEQQKERLIAAKLSPTPVRAVLDSETLAETLLIARPCQTADGVLDLAQDVCGSELVITESGLRSAQDFARHDFNARRLLTVLLKLSREVLPEIGAGHAPLQRVFGSSYKPHESEVTGNNQAMRSERMFALRKGDKPVYCAEHISVGRFMRVYFKIDAGSVYIVYCGEHLEVASSN
ncbi:hypothetical protein [Crenobacter intestini]|uniref:Uncharacterized protein n=1 Tax=Crenobacter intestini TaxID=2563443 RepID=A0A4T0UP60_9NEIS|nr:hypothetical protein [Crenobacter intestini]TIC80321.1 hypothetical protein E5K04_12510 [Crenobacter intestini]